jgi:hypothetical protein
MNWLPKHKSGLYLTHNEHKDVYEDATTFYDFDDFVSKEELNKAIKEDSVWKLQWYPHTPIAFNVICASSLAAIEQAVKELEEQ